MPIYEYQCDACGHTCEKLEKISSEPSKTCPECGKDTLKRLVSSTNFQLKGTGWYVTDFKDKPKGQDSAERGQNNSTTNSE